MPLSLKLVTPPTVEPVTVALAKSQCRVDFNDDDALIAVYISAARAHAEKVTHRAFYNQTWVRTLDFFPASWSYHTTNPAEQSAYPYGFWDRLTIDIPRANLVSVASITYVDNTGEEQTLDPTTYTVDTSSTPGRITPVQGAAWPAVSNFMPGSIAITFVAGSYGDGTDVNTCPATVVMAILLLVGHFYANRENSTDANLKNIPLGFDALLSGEKVVMFGYR
jgi:uncharacterized phiE125 gp8 family phage protein